MNLITFSQQQFFSNSSKELSINIINRSFRFSDKRGFSQFSPIEKSFAEQVVKAFPTKILHQERFNDMLSGNGSIVLKWNLYAGGLVDLLIHYNQVHVFTSELVEAPTL